MSATTPAAEPGKDKKGKAAKATKAPRAGRGKAAAGASVATNRREIPVSSFDFTAGMYKQTVLARRVSFGVLSIAVLAVVFFGYQVLSARSEAGSLRAELDALSQRETAVVQSLGTATGGVDPRLVIERDLSLSDSLSRVAQNYPDYKSVLSEIQKVQVPGVVVVDLKIGLSAMGKGADKDFDGKNGVPVRITAQAPDLLSAVTWADQMRRSPMFSELAPTGDNGSVLVGYIKPAEPASLMVTRLADLGVAYKEPSAQAPAQQDEDAAAGTADPAAEGDPAADPAADPAEEASQ